MSRFASLVVASALMPLLACSSAAPVESATVASTLTSSTRTFLVPVDARARVLCRAEVNAYYCDADATHAAVSACLAKIGASGASDACATDDPRCVRTETFTEPCAGKSNPVYPDAIACESPRPQNCSFYGACVDAQTPCGDDGYALGYGEKYCTAFKNINGLTPRGSAWRDSVMHCLQEELVPFSDPSSTATCSEILDTAFASHPRCYTRPENSICFLPPSDVLAILNTIGGGELLTARSRKQILSTIGACIGQIGHWLFPFGASSRMAAAMDEPAQRPPLTDDELREYDRFWRELERTYAE
jgi:hypothetical protein